MSSAVSIRQVLVPTDLSGGAERALEHAGRLAERFQAALTLYHALLLPDNGLARWAAGDDSRLWERTETQIRDALGERARHLPGETHVIVERSCSIHSSIVDLVRKLQPDLTVMATHGRQGLAHLLLGSVTEKVVERVFRPVLCLREAEHGQRFPYRRILVPTDLSLASRLAFPMAASLARALGSDVTGVHVIPSTPSSPTLSGMPPAEPAVIPSEAHLWKFFQTDFDGVPLSAQVLRGAVWERIVHLARVEEADLIVMSTRGHDSLADHILGSTTERVVRHAPCPVLVA